MPESSDAKTSVREDYLEILAGGDFLDRHFPSWVK